MFTDYMNEKELKRLTLGDDKIFFSIVLSALKKLDIKTLTLYDLDAENQQQHHKYLNDTISSLSNKYISFKPKIENYFAITDMNIDKYRGLTILMNENYLNTDALSKMLEKTHDSNFHAFILIC